MNGFWTLERVRTWLSLRRALDLDHTTHFGLPDRPTSFTRVAFSGFGVRVSADGKTGRAALRIIRREHSALFKVVCGYLVTAGVLLVVLALTVLL